MNRLMVIAAVVSLLMVSGLAGWLQAGTQSYSINANQTQWRTPPGIEDAPAQMASLRKRVLGSPYFQSINATQEEVSEQPDEEDSAMTAAEKKYGPFPHIISISRIDGLDTAQLRQPDNMILSVHAGDELPSGWVITSISSDHLVAEAGTERFSFAVFEHMSMQEPDKADE